MKVKNIGIAHLSAPEQSFFTGYRTNSNSDSQGVIRINRFITWIRTEVWKDRVTACNGVTLFLPQSPEMRKTGFYPIR